MKYKIVIFSMVFFLLLILNASCTSCSRSGRAQIIAMAQKEAAKKNTIPEPNTIIKDVEPEIVMIEDVVTPKERIVIKKELIKSRIPEAEGDLIQVEGLIAKEVYELTIDLETGSNQINQIIAMRNYVFSHWHYVFDPASGHDTWRSAEATLSLKYKGKYSGDCDDFAILLASFARQIGLRSRMVGGYDGDSGHAFAEFLLEDKEANNNKLKGIDYRIDFSGKWISLDWFQGVDHERFTQNIKVYEDI
ncbi:MULTISPECIES: transglutaminase-like domain-containing protein [unclassified Polaribacter]|uniref:transglutaminase-like domain-containing protein n=1 Tax=unclassified Polaribacter TaxID=196858 RepID=UPI0011BFDF47|nr:MULTISPECIES: transglutaminase-like domain-containing protein [unclassified Polaribacter]TXD53120.1 transglutaminase domain-containing protein [Polaribacter sp. IC063]TXD61240.1 transglutaminase domain-containing protein [Polaribacter sp. IC066]